MPNFDVVICLGQANLNKIAAGLHGRATLRRQVFSGSSSSDIVGLKANVSWDIEQPPLFNLIPPAAHQVDLAISADGSKPAVGANAFVVTLPRFHLRLETSAAPVDFTTSLDLICTIQLQGPIVSLSPLGVIFDLSKLAADDQIIFKQILVPQVLTQMATMLKGTALPNIHFSGIAFGGASVLVEGGRAIGAAFLEGHPGIPAVEALHAAPKGDFYVLLSEDALQRVVQSGVQPLRGRTESKSGSVDFKIGSATYQASMRLDSLDAQVTSPTTLRVQAGLTLDASAGIDLFPAIVKQIEHGVTDAAEAVANVASDAAKGVKDAAEAVAGGLAKAGGAVAHEAQSVAKSIGHAISSY